MEKLGLIAGGGALPLEVAQDCVAAGRHVFVIRLKGFADEELADFPGADVGLAAVHQFSRIGHYAFIGGVSAVTKDVIPFGSVWGVHAHLEGLNLVGLKRRGFSREEINDLRSAYRLLFAEEGTFQERLEDVGRVFSGAKRVMEIVNFIRADNNRPLCLPRNDD